MKIEDIELREASMEELGLLRTLEQKVVDAERPFNASIKQSQAIYYDLENLLTSESALVMVAEYKAKVIGTGYIQIRPSKVSLTHKKHGYLGFMYVDESCRGIGVNKLIMDNLVAWGKAQDIRDFYLDVYAENASAVKAYEKSGFSKSMIEMKLSLG